MAPDSIETIKTLFETAEEKEKIDYLFTLIFRVSEETKNALAEISGDIKRINTRCIWREELCKEYFASKEAIKGINKQANGFITKKQAKIYGFVITAFAVGIGIGTGLITWAELAKRAIP